MRLPVGSLAINSVRSPVLWAAAMLLALGGCDSCQGTCAPAAPTSRIEIYTPDAGMARAQSPVSPVGAPGQTPVAPPQNGQTPSSPEGRPDTESVSANALALKKIDGLDIGMSYERVSAALGEPGALIAGSETDNSVYRWNFGGVSFMGRFEQGLLTRKNVVRPYGGAGMRGDGNSKTFDQELFDAILPGMAFDEVSALIGLPPQRLTGSDSGVALYKWTDWRGSSIVGRFENRELTRKSGGIVSGDEETPAEAPAREGVAPDISYRFPITWQRIPGESAEEEAAEELESDGHSDDEAMNDAPVSRVRVAGASRRERELAADSSSHAGRSYRPTARFPDYGRRLRRGDFEIRIRNQSSVPVDAAVISDAGGQDMTIASGGTASIFVGRGSYALYYIYSDDPFTLYQGQPLPVASTLSDYVVNILDDSYTVNFLDRNIEPGGVSRR